MKTFRLKLSNKRWKSEPQQPDFLFLCSFQVQFFYLTVGPLIGRYCGTRVPPEIHSSTGILSLSFHTDMAVAKDGFSARYNMTHKEVSESKFEMSLFITLTWEKNKYININPFTAFHCSNPFGMESGKITDDQISASTSFYDERWLPRQARLNFNDNGWTPNEDSNREYIQVKLQVIQMMETPRCRDKYVKNWIDRICQFISLLYRSDTNLEVFYQDNG